jgi:hypothetical protein
VSRPRAAGQEHSGFEEYEIAAALILKNAHLGAAYPCVSSKKSKIPFVLPLMPPVRIIV